MDEIRALSNLLSQIRLLRDEDTSLKPTPHARTIRVAATLEKLRDYIDLKP
jgi:hypothetical protein